MKRIFLSLMLIMSILGCKKDVTKVGDVCIMSYSELGYDLKLDHLEVCHVVITGLGPKTDNDKYTPVKISFDCSDVIGEMIEIPGHHPAEMEIIGGLDYAALRNEYGWEGLIDHGELRLSRELGARPYSLREIIMPVAACKEQFK